MDIIHESVESSYIQDSIETNMNPIFLTSELNISNLNPPDLFEIDEINRTVQDRGDWPTIKFALKIDTTAKIAGISTYKTYLKTYENIISTDRALLQTRTGLLIVDRQESSKWSYPAGVLQITLTAYFAEMNGEEVLVMREYGLKWMARKMEEWSVVYLSEKSIAELVASNSLCKRIENHTG
jgi:hypothetical protein